MSKLPVVEAPSNNVSAEILDQAEEFKISALSKYGKIIASKIDNLTINFVSDNGFWVYQYERYPNDFNLLFLKVKEIVIYRGQIISEQTYLTYRRENIES